MSDKTRTGDPTWAVVPEPDRPGDVPCLCRGARGVEPRWREDTQLWHLRVGSTVYGVSRRARDVIAGALELVDAKRALPNGNWWPMVDGEPVMPGDVLWDAETVRRIRVDRVYFDRDGTVLVAGDGEEIRAAGIDGIAYPAGAVSLDDLTRTEPPKPVLDRDGVPIEVGDTVYALTGDAEGSRLTVERVGRGTFCVRARSASGHVYQFRGEDLAHQRPDSWQRLEEDAAKGACEYFGSEHCECGGCPHDMDPDCNVVMVMDIVRRAKALAGVDDE